jgi:hypothetical protein
MTKARPMAKAFAPVSLVVDVAQEKRWRQAVCDVGCLAAPTW